MSIIGIDLGSHAASIAVWHEDKDLLEVLADDLGFRTIPSIVAFRGEESIVGHSAMSQQHKNAPNTFEDVRSLLFDITRTNVHVPQLEKELSIEEINSIFFRNIHNQVKQQAGKVIREAVVTVPYKLDEVTSKRFVAAAQAGGIRIKSFIEDATAALLAYGLDEPTLPSSTTLVVDLGWSRCDVALYNIANGLFVPLASKSSTDVCGSIFVKALSEFCAKDFTKKYKVPIQENAKSMMRLKRECENAMKTLSTGQEATIDLDSLCEGIDYSFKVSRARFEDLLSIPIIHFKNLINGVLTQANVNALSIHRICLAGGCSAIPKITTILKSFIPNAMFPKVRFETYEATCIGAALHGKLLMQLNLLEKPPVNSPEGIKGLTRNISISNNSDANGEKLIVINQNTPLPAMTENIIKLPEGAKEGTVYIFVSGENVADPAVLLGGMTLKSEEMTEEIVLRINVDENQLSANFATVSTKNILKSLEISMV